MNVFENRTIVLGVTGSIAAYKAADLCSRLVKRGAKVRTVMTANACKFVSPLTFQAISQNPVATDMFSQPDVWEMEHISLADAADLVIIAPATANIIAKTAVGIADDLLTTTLLAVRCPVLIAPAMNPRMYLHPVTQENIRRLKARGVQVMQPGEGRTACGDIGPGRMPEPEEILSAAEALLARQEDLSGWRLLVTAGPTRQWIDPVRFVSNPSTGKMGYAIAEAAVSRGAEVVLVSGPTFLDAPAGVDLRRVETTYELLDAAVEAFEHCDAAICAAAPADHAPQTVAQSKIKRETNSNTTGSVLELKLYPTPDVAAELGRRKSDRVLVVFAAETENLIENALRKMQTKNADMVVANDVTSPGSGFGADTNQVCLICADGSVEQLPLMSKSALAHEILNRIVPLLQKRRPRKTFKE